jgi:hypothetical protein
MRRIAVRGAGLPLLLLPVIHYAGVFSSALSMEERWRRNYPLRFPVREKGVDMIPRSCSSPASPLLHRWLCMHYSKLWILLLRLPAPL